MQIINSTKYSMPHLVAVIQAYGDRIVVSDERVTYCGHDITDLVSLDGEDIDIAPAIVAQIVADQYGDGDDDDIVADAN